MGKKLADLCETYKRILEGLEAQTVSLQTLVIATIDSNNVGSGQVTLNVLREHLDMHHEQIRELTRNNIIGGNVAHHHQQGNNPPNNLPPVGGMLMNRQFPGYSLVVSLWMSLLTGTSQITHSNNRMGALVLWSASK
jgi:hypothetical protein